jgi:hypothetical protein
MGLDTSHDCWHGAYGAFARWRLAIAKAAGYPVTAGEGGYGEDYVLPWDEFEARNYQGEWDRVPGDDPLLYLLAHSDCDGVIHPEHGAHVAARLEQLLPLLDGTTGNGHIQPHMRGTTEQFIAGLLAAAAAGEDVEFC